MWKLGFVFLLFECVQTVNIVNLKVPEIIQYGTKDHVILDCEYIADNVTGLVLKWFFNDRTQPVYQWIPPKKPQVLGILKDKVDLNYTVSDNIYTMNRALKIMKPGTELSGDYTCVVSTFLSEDSKTKSMTVFVPEKKFYLVQDKLDDEYLNLICAAEGVFPRPNLTVSAGHRLLLGAKTSVTCTGNRYSAVTSAMLRLDTLPDKLDILCELIVPEANYFSRKRDIYYKNPPSTTTHRVPTPSDAHLSPDNGTFTKLSYMTIAVVTSFWLLNISNNIIFVL